MNDFDPIEAARTRTWSESMRAKKEKLPELSFASPYAQQEMGYIVNVPCPRCDNRGPHERVGVSMDGSHLVALCRNFACSLTWKVSGPEVVR